MFSPAIYLKYVYVFCVYVFVNVYVYLDMI